MSNTSDNGGATQILAGLLQARTGQIISPNRYWRIETSLKPVLQEFCIPDIDSLVAALLGADNEELVQASVEAMLNNESYFFRDSAMFNMLRNKVLPTLKEKRISDKRLRIWCAGCSTGQEVYSLAMHFADDRTQWAGWKIEITGTDISQTVLDKARSGRYTQFEIQRGLSVTHMLRYFTQDGESWIMKPEIRDMVQFRSDNIMRPTGKAGEYDMVLCRNVLLYFSPETRHIAFSRLARSIRPDGYLMLGAAETVIGQTTNFVADQEIRGVYTLIGADEGTVKTPAYTGPDRRNKGRDSVQSANWPFANEA